VGVPEGRRNTHARDTAATLQITDTVAHRWHRFPCRGKQPRPGWRWAEWNTADPEKLRSWLEPGDSTGIACGPSGLVVIDLDVPKPGFTFPTEWQQPGIRDGKDVFAALCERACQPWPATYSTATPSGGWHLYFTADPQRKIGNSAGQLGPLVDVRGDGGYVIAYPPWDDSDPVPLPGWLADLCAPPARPAAPATASVPRQADAYIRAAVEAEVAAVAGAWEGSRNSQLNRSAYALARFAADGRLDWDAAAAVLTAAARHAGLADTEIARTLASARNARGRA
jgi:hypothetical protein